MKKQHESDFKWHDDPAVASSQDPNYQELSDSLH